MILSIVLAAAPVLEIRPDRPANAAVRIMNSGRTTSKDWDVTAASRRREIVIEEPGGRKIRLKVIDFE